MGKKCEKWTRFNIEIPVKFRDSAIEESNKLEEGDHQAIAFCRFKNGKTKVEVRMQSGGIVKVYSTKLTGITERLLLEDIERFIGVEKRRIQIVVLIRRYGKTRRIVKKAA